MRAPFRLALVTGATGGLGKALSHLLAKNKILHGPSCLSIDLLYRLMLAICRLLPSSLIEWTARSICKRVLSRNRSFKLFRYKRNPKKSTISQNLKSDL